MKHIDSARAARKLGVSQTVVRNMVRNGLLNDFGQTKTGRNRHHIILDQSEVKAFADTHRRAGRSWVQVQPNQPKTRQAKPKQARHQRPAAIPVQTFSNGTHSGAVKGRVLERLDRIETLVQKLYDEWGG